jgi:uncharacterized protein
MKFQPESAEGVNLISRHEGARVWVGGTPFAHSVLVPWRGEVRRWHAAAPAELTAMHFDEVLALQPEIVVFGSGARLQFVAPALYRALIDSRVGVETMDTAAACRTYNVLASERRSVVAALLLPDPAGS